MTSSWALARLLTPQKAKYIFPYIEEAVIEKHATFTPDELATILAAFGLVRCQTPTALWRVVSESLKVQSSRPPTLFEAANLLRAASATNIVVHPSREIKEQLGSLAVFTGQYFYSHLTKKWKVATWLPLLRSVLFLLAFPSVESPEHSVGGRTNHLFIAALTFAVEYFEAISAEPEPLDEGQITVVAQAAFLLHPAWIFPVESDIQFDLKQRLNKALFQFLDSVAGRVKSGEILMTNRVITALLRLFAKFRFRNKDVVRSLLAPLQKQYTSLTVSQASIILVSLAEVSDIM